MSEERENLYQYLAEIARRSFEGEINWTQPNPSTFQWVQETDDELYITTIQKASMPHTAGNLQGLKSLKDSYRKSVYLFQVQDKRKRQVLLSLSTRDRNDVYEPLERIYEAAEKGMDVRASNILKKLLN
ncbi:MAG: hypothetical protein ACX933_16525 [Marinobacter adhaerens]